ncbi:MAG: hypothetical protein FJX29_12525 [Alphaproteobacteria bacterium]|nr:hypothetical protein [Alphaproteobacteria bacterium]
MLEHTEDEDCLVCRAAGIADYISASASGCYALDDELPNGAIEMAVLVQMAGRLSLQGISEEVLRDAIREGIEIAQESKAASRAH